MAIEMQSVINGFLEGSIRTTGREPVINELIVSENGTYIAPSDIDGYNPVIVNVPKTPLNKLTVTENGTYTAPTDTGYDEVNVNVPLPSNVYLLKEIEDVDIASFSDGSNLPMPKLQVGIEPQQDLHGYDAPWVGGAGKNKFDATTLMANVNSSIQYVTITLKPNTTYTMSTSLGKIDNVCNLFFMLPNESASSASNGVYSGLSISVTSGNDGQVKVGYRLPSDGTTSAQYLAKQYQIEEGTTATSYAPYSNICPISGWDEVNVTVADDVETPTVSNVYTIDLDGTRYGGKVDLVSGVLTVDRASKTVADCYWYGSNGFFYTGTFMDEIVHGDGRYDHCISDVYATKNVAQSSSLVNGEMSVDASGYLQLKDARYSSTSDFKTAMGTSQLVYELATPLTIQLTPTEVKSLLGSNNVWADTGSINNIEYFAK